MNFEQDSTLSPRRLENTNIYLRQARLSDFEKIKAYRQDPENCRYIAPPEDDSKTKSIVEQLAKPWLFSVGHWNGYVICATDDDTVIGEVVFRVEDWDCQRVEMGYRLSPLAAGRGICKQAATLLIDYLFELGCFKIVAKCDPRNTASYRVMETLGFIREAYFKQHYLWGTQWCDQYDYGLLASQWRSNT